MTNVRTHNQKAWDTAVPKGNIWTHPVSPGIIANARQGEWGSATRAEVASEQLAVISGGPDFENFEFGRV